MVTTKENNIQLELVRYNGSLNEVSVSYETVMLPGASVEGGVPTNAAVVDSDFPMQRGTVMFAPGEVSIHQLFNMITNLRL